MHKRERTQAARAQQSRSDRFIEYPQHALRTDLERGGEGRLVEIPPQYGGHLQCVDRRGRQPPDPLGDHLADGRRPAAAVEVQHLAHEQRVAARNSGALALSRQAPQATAHPLATARSEASVARRLLPVPGSPASSIRPPRPARTSSTNAVNEPSSVRRPIRGWTVPTVTEQQ